MRSGWMLRCIVAAAAGIGRIKTKSPDLQKLSTSQHLSENVLGNGDLTAVHVLNKSGNGASTEIGRQHNVEHCVAAAWTVQALARMGGRLMLMVW